MGAMSWVLGIETSRGLCSAALCGDEPLGEHTRKMQRAHNEHILELAERAMAAAGQSPMELDGVAFGCGPGSFTGIRIAASVAQAIAFGAGAKILPISSTLALATAAAQQGLAAAGGVIVSIRSRRDAHYLASFQVSSKRRAEPAKASSAFPSLPELQVCHPDCLAESEPGWMEMASDWPVAGDRPAWLPPGRAVHSQLSFGAGLIARMGVRALAEGRGLAPEQGLPAYVAGDSPWLAAPGQALAP